MSDHIEEARASWRVVTLEIATSFAVSALFVWACSNIRVNTMQRIGQVSATAAVELRFLFFGIPLLLALVLAAKLRGGRAWPITSRLVCAALAGLSSGVVAGGILAVLGHSKYGLGGVIGDAGTLIWWADLVRMDINPSGIYPPGQVDLLVWIGNVTSLPSEYAIKWFQIGGLVAMGPLAYASWRLLLRPGWALGIGVVASLGLVEAYRPYPMMVLIVFIPLAIKFLDVLRRSYDFTFYELVRAAVLFGMAFGAAFLMYSGWYQWSAPGFVVAALAVFPWRRRWQAGALLCGLTLVVFVLFSHHYILEVLRAPALRDDYFYFDVTVEPAYIAMWRGGLHGITGTYPPLGELGGVGMFTIILAVGIGAAIIFGRGHSAVIAIVAMMTGTWLLRYWHAHNMYSKKLVQLYPRTTAELFYCSVLLTLFAVYFVTERMRASAAAESPLRRPTALIGACTGFLFLSMSTSSATIDKYMPEETELDPGHMAWVALKTPMLHESQARGAKIEVTSSSDDGGYSVSALIDGKPQTAWSSKLGIKRDHEESIVLELPSARQFSKIRLTPAADGFPVEFTIDLWDGYQWQPRIFKTDFPQPTEPELYYFPHLEVTGRIRVHARKLRRVGDDYVFRLAEIELLF